MTPERIATAATAVALLVVVAGGAFILRSLTHPTVRSTAVSNPRLTSPSLVPPSPTPSAGSSATSQFQGVQATMPSCSSAALFSVSPIKFDKIAYIVPLGGPNPLPGEHVYFIIIRGGPNSSGPTQIVNLYAPGDLTAFRIGRQVQTTNGKTGNIDYYVYFTPCREVTVLFAHVSSLTGPLGGIPFDTCAQPYSIGDGSLYEHCTAEINIPLRAGQLIGTAGAGAAAGIDFDINDWRVPVPYVANPDRQYDLTAVCPLDYYGGDAAASLRALLGHGSPGTHLAQGCGQIFQDIAGTLQGNWFNGPPAQTNGNITKMAALVHENYNPTLDAISIGGTIGIHGEWDFAPTHSGTINRDYSEVTPGDSIYCYQAAGMPGRLLIQLVTATTVSIEHQPGACTGTFAFISATAYQR